MYTIIREIQFDAQMLVLTASYSRMDDVDSCIDWALQGKAVVIPGIVSLGEGFYLWAPDELAGIDALTVRILYQVDEPNLTVRLISITYTSNEINTEQAAQKNDWIGVVSSCCKRKLTKARNWGFFIATPDTQRLDIEQ